MFHTRRLLTAAALLVCVLPAAAARADTIIDGGSVVFNGHFTGGTFDLRAGNRYRLSGVTEDGMEGCIPCRAGTNPIIPSHSYNIYYRRDFVAGKTHYANPAFVGLMSFSAPPLPTLLSKRPRLSSVVPFSFVWGATICNYPENPEYCSQYSPNFLLRETFRGQGVMTVTLSGYYLPNHGWVYESRRIQFDFMPATDIPVALLRNYFSQFWQK